MKVVKNITIELSHQELEKIIAKHLESEGYILENVSWKHGTRLVGYGFQEREAKYFEGASIRAKIIKDDENE